MPRATRKTRPQLTESWGTFDDDISERSGESADDEFPDLSAIEELHVPQPSPRMATTPRSGPRRGNRAGVQSSRNITPTTRRSSRIGKSTSLEPEFMMPSPSMNGSMEKSHPRNSPTARARRRSQYEQQEHKETPRRALRAVARHDQQYFKDRQGREEGPSIMSILWTNCGSPILRYAGGLLGSTLGWLQPFFGLSLALAFLGVLAYLVVMYLFSYLFSVGPLSYAPSLASYMASPCSIPGAAIFPPCWSSSSTSSNPTPQVPEFEGLMKVSSAFEDVLDTAAAGYTLPLAMKHSESSIRDLRSVIKHSFLPSKHSLEFEMSGFIDTAREASADLSKFNSHIGRAVDHIIVSNRFTLQVLEGVADSDADRGALLRIFSWADSGTLTEYHVLERYLRQTSEIEEEIQRLIMEAQTLLKLLENLDERLDVIHDIVTRDGVHLAGSREELFAQLWTKLGGNRATAAKMDKQMDLLRWVGAHRKQAMQHVTHVVVKLQAIHAELENLREHVAEPEVAGVEISLQQHVETILLGVERLERVRESNRAAEKDVYRGIMDRKDPATAGTGGVKEVEGAK